MKGSSIFKKVLPILAAIVVIIVIAVTVSLVKSNAKKVSAISDKDKAYLEITETIDGKNYTYSVSRGELYDKLKKSIGLSTAITMANKDILKDAKNSEGVSIWDSITEDEIKKAINDACYGEDVDPETLTDEEKTEKEETFLNTMYTGYGYKAEALDSPDIIEHYTLVLSKKAYAKVALDKLISEAANDDPYFSDSDIQTYYDEHYDSSFYAILVPFKSDTQFKMALQQQGVKSESTKWVYVTLTPDGDKGYKLEEGTDLNPAEVIETLININNSIQPDKTITLGEAEIVTDDSGKKEYKVNNGDYAIVDISIKVQEAKDAANALLAELEKDGDERDVPTINEKLADAKTKVNALKGETPSDDAVDNILNLLQEIDDIINENVTPDAQTSDPLTLGQDVKDKVNAFSEKTYIFNLDNTDSPLYFDYTSLYEYDSTLPSKISSGLTVYTPFTTNTAVSANWYTKTSLSVNSVYYAVIKLAELDAKELSEVRDEIIEKLKEEKLTEAFIEEQMAKLRKEYEFKFYEKDLDADYVDAMSSYVELKNNKKRDTSKVFSTTLKAYTADDLFNALEKTAGRTTAISEISYQRLLNNTLFNTYKDYSTGKWTEDGKETKDNIVSQIESQRLYFLTGSYTSYGYDPTTMTWKDFMYEVNGVEDEYALADMLLYSTIANDYIGKVLDFAQIDGEGVNQSLKMSYADTSASEVWQLVEQRMNDLIADYFSVSGEHLLVSLYKDVKDAINSNEPIDPKDWTEDQKAAAQELIKDIQNYLLAAEGTYATKLQAIVTAFDAAPFAITDVTGAYVKIIDDNGNLYKYDLSAGEATIDLAKYKSLGFTLKYESLGTFTNGKMVENFNNAAQSIWAKDHEDGVTDRITVYPDAIETIYGYHLYVNLGSNELEKHDSVVCDADGNTMEDTVESVLPTLYEIRAYILQNALKSVSTTDLSEEDKTRLDNLLDELNEILETAVTNSLTEYYDAVVNNLTSSYFNSVLQQTEIKGLLANATINSNQFTTADLADMIDATFVSTYKTNLTNLEQGDEALFDITGQFKK